MGLDVYTCFIPCVKMAPCRVDKVHKEPCQDARTKMSTSFLRIEQVVQKVLV